MPGFAIDNKGGDTPPIGNEIETRRNHRWRFTSLGNGLTAEFLILLQKCQRPKFTNEEPVMHHNQEQVYFIGKQSWETITMSFYDSQARSDCGEAVWTWLNIGNIIPNANVSLPSTYKKQGQLDMVDGMGQANETWKLHGCWPKEVSYSELDYTNTDIALIDVVLRFDRAIREK